ncbi:MAG TPA: response regulator [Vicinamibacterales bacterium]|nr:response regulator [Vicinamibacterales bacterium]
MPPASRRAATVLVVDDDPSLRDLYEKVLTLEGYAVIVAEDGVEALKYVENGPVDAVVLDLMMPRLDGRSVKRGFDANAAMKNVPVILVTGHVAPDLDPHEFSCVLHKPISVEALVKAVRDCLARHPS